MVNSGQPHGRRMPPSPTISQRKWARTLPLTVAAVQGVSPCRYRGGSKRPSMAVHPPSTISTVPVTKLAASEARYTTAPAISCG